MMPARLRAVLTSRITALAVTLAIFALLLRRVPLDRLAAALEQADYPRFLAIMIANTIFYFCWDTLVLATVIRWFHAPIGYRALLPVRAASYVVALFNANAGRGALAAFLSRQLGSPFLQLGSTVLFLLMTEYLHLVSWALAGMLQVRADVSRDLLLVPPAVAAVWLVVFAATRLGAGGNWALLRTFRLAPARRYVQIVLLRAPMFFVSLCLHYYAARAFGVEIPFLPLLAFLPVVFMLAALPVSVAHLGTTQAAWVFFFGAYAAEPRLLAFSLAAHLTFVASRGALGILFLPWAYADLVKPRTAVS